MSKQIVNHYVGDNLYQIYNKINNVVSKTDYKVVNITSLFKTKGTYPCEAIVIYEKENSYE